MNKREAEWARLAEEASQGPWESRRAYGLGAIYAPGTHLVVADACPGSTQCEPDAAFIAAARTAVPELLAEVKRLREALRPFAEEGKGWLVSAKDVFGIRDVENVELIINVGDLRRAARALAESGDE